MNINSIKNKLNKIIKKIKKDYFFEFFFIILNAINGLLLRILTIKNGFSIAPFFMDIFFLIIICLIGMLFKKRENKNKFLLIITVILTIDCIVNNIYFHYYNSFASISMLSNLVFAKDVGNAIVENVIKIVDFIYIIPTFLFFKLFKLLKKRKYFDNEFKYNIKNILKKSCILLLILISVSAIFMPQNAWVRFYKLWNRESVVMNFGIYLYQIDDFIQSFVPKVNSLLGKDKALKRTIDYYSDRKTDYKKNEFSNIYEGKNVLVIHYESMQTIAMHQKFNGKEVTPVLNKLASEGIFFKNFYSQVGVGTSSDAEFTFNTSLMPSNKGTVFVNYFDREYVAIPKLLKDKGYYTFSMHGNSGDFWNRNIMHKNLGYEKFYSKDSYEIDEIVGLGLSDKSFYRQSIDKIKQIKEEQKKPFYGLLITLSNHTPFNDFEIIEEFPTTIDINIDGQTITREYINNTLLGNYFRTVHYADKSLGYFINELDKEGLLDNTVIVIYGDHDARLGYSNFNKLYNYDPITNTIMNEKDEGYIPYNKYGYKVDQNVPFIIWTKDNQITKEVETPMGMIDVLPTLGNMLGIRSKYQLGKDIFNIENDDNTVTFVDGSFITSKIYYDLPKGQIYPIVNDPIDENYVNNRIKYSSNLIEISNNIISFDLIKELNNKIESDDLK